jgi:aspartate carbamoyltransferase catalytic subunit
MCFFNIDMSFFEQINRVDTLSLIERQKTRVIVSRSHAGSVKQVINEHLKNAEIIIAAGSGTVFLFNLKHNTFK